MVELFCQFSGLACQAAIADSRHPTLPAEITTDFGNRPRLISRQSVVLENEVTPNTSFSFKKRSSFRMVGECLLDMDMAMFLGLLGNRLFGHQSLLFECFAMVMNSTAGFSCIRQLGKSSTARFSVCRRHRYPMPSRRSCWSQRTWGTCWFSGGASAQSGPGLSGVSLRLPWQSR